MAPHQSYLISPSPLERYRLRSACARRMQAPTSTLRPPPPDPKLWYSRITSSASTHFSISCRRCKWGGEGGLRQSRLRSCRLRRGPPRTLGLWAAAARGRPPHSPQRNTNKQSTPLLPTCDSTTDATKYKKRPQGGAGRGGRLDPGLPTVSRALPLLLLRWWRCCALGGRLAALPSLLPLPVPGPCSCSASPAAGWCWCCPWPCAPCCCCCCCCCCSLGGNSASCRALSLCPLHPAPPRLSPNEFPAADRRANNASAAARAPDGLTACMARACCCCCG